MPAERVGSKYTKAYREGKKYTNQVLIAQNYSSSLRPNIDSTNQPSIENECSSSGHCFCPRDECLHGLEEETLPHTDSDCEIGGIDSGTNEEMRDEHDEQLLYENATITLTSVISLLLHLVVFCKIPTSKVDYVLKTIAEMLPPRNLLPKTKAQLFKALPDFGKMTKIFYCSKCNHLGDCTNDHRSKDFFLYHSLSSQLQNRMNQDPKFIQNINYCYEREPDGYLRDVFDGSIFLSQDWNKNTLHFQINWDGISPFKSSTHSIWPLYVVVLNLPPEVRYNPENIFLVGVWFGKDKPSIDLFLKHFSNDLKVIEVQGVEQHYKGTGEGAIKKWFGSLLSTVCDLPAKCLMYCLNNHNGSNGCGFCLHSGISLFSRWVFPVESNFS